MSSISEVPGTPGDTLLGRTLHNGEYMIESVLGQGGMSCVYLAFHTTLHIPLAIKRGKIDRAVPAEVTTELERILYSTNPPPRTISSRLSDNDFPSSRGISTDRFIREALLLARLQHPSIPSLYDYFFEDASWYLVMDYISGPTLGHYMQDTGSLPVLEALNYAMQLCDVLDYLHKQTPPVIYRDLKPSNILLAPDGRVMLVDFGIARYFKPGRNTDTTELGSPGYAPPEQYQGEGQTDGRSDLYSLGIILHEMLSGQQPTQSGETQASAHAFNPALSPTIGGLVTVATRPEPMYRFQTAHTFYLALERAYTIEERHIHQQRAGSDDKTQQQPGGTPPGEELIRPSYPASIPLSQRMQTREILQAARRKRLEQERMEMHLTSVDEGLSRRSYAGMSSSSLPLLEETKFRNNQRNRSKASLRPLSSSRTSSRVIQSVFLLVMLLFVVIASFFVYRHYLPQFQSAILGQQIGTTPTTDNQGTDTTLSTPTSTPPATNTPTPLSTSGSWQQLPSLPSFEADNTATYVELQGQTYIYMSAGYRGQKVSPHYDHGLYRYNIATAHWEKVLNTGFPGMVNNAVAQDEQHTLFFTAGYSPDTQTIPSLLYMYQPSNGSLQKIVPPGQVSLGFGGSMIADQHGHLYISQGFLHAGSTHTPAGTAWYRYDISTNTWKTLAPLPLGIGYAILAQNSPGKILLLGGSVDAGQHRPSVSIYQYDTVQNTWQLLPAPSPIALSGATSCRNSSRQLVIIGGDDAAHHKSLNTVWSFDVSTLNLQSLPPLPSGGSLLGATACDGNGHVYLVRGANNLNRPTADFWVLTIK